MESLSFILHILAKLSEEEKGKIYVFEIRGGLKMRSNPTIPTV